MVGRLSASSVFNGAAMASDRLPPILPLIQIPKQKKPGAVAGLLGTTLAFVR